MSIFDAHDADFATAVLERSSTVPVVVDFWAPWCGPCKQLAPVLEGVAAEMAGAFELARVNVDENPEVAAKYGVRSIPLVVAFRDGEPVREFTGAQPESAIRAFLASVLPNEADTKVAAARAHEEAGEPEAAEAALREALAIDPRHAGALVALARGCAARGDAEAGLAHLDQIVAASPALEAEARALAAALRTGDAGGDLDALRAAVDAAPDDLDTRLALGRALAAAQAWDEALPALLAIVERDRDFADQAARKAMLDGFELLGGEHPLTQEYRGRLATALFR